MADTHTLSPTEPLAARAAAHRWWLWRAPARLWARAPRALGLVKLGRAYSHLAGISGVLVLLFIQGLDPALTTSFLYYLLIVLSWALGFTAFAAALDRRLLPDVRGVESLARLRGQPAAQASPIWFLATLRVLSVPVGWALFLSLLRVGLPGLPGVTGFGLMNVLCIVVYFGFLALVLAFLSSAFSGLGWRHSRWLFAGVWLLPYLFSQVSGFVPSLPEVFGQLLESAVFRRG